MRILIVEDDAALGTFLERGLRLEGHEAQVTGDGYAAVRMATERMHDLIVLDLSLPQKDGIQVLEEFRQKAVDASILVLTGRNAVEDRVRCLDLGADDFLMKPFSFSELTARCRALMRRRERFADPTLRQGDLELHRMERRVVRNGRAVELKVKEFALLEYLMLARGRTCSRSELLKEVWQMSPDAGTNVVDVYVNYLRKKLCAGQPPVVCSADGEMEPDRLIETVRGEGYSIRMAGGAFAGERKAVARIGLAEATAARARVDGFGRPVRGSDDFGRQAFARA
jgi:DNA-binding response OmpR family regulator